MMAKHQAGEFVYRTSHLHEAELVANELERLGVAFYRAQERPLGVHRDDLHRATELSFVTDVGCHESRI